MNDSNKKPKRLLKTINRVLREYFDIRRQRAEIELRRKKKVAKLTAWFEAQDGPLAEQEDSLKQQLRELIIPQRALLLTGKLKSFATTYGSVSFAQKRETLKVIDPKGFEKQARSDRNLGRLGKFVREWKPEAKRISAWFKANPDGAKRYASFVELDGGYDELFVQSNDTYLTEFDPNRLTEKSVNLGKAELEAKAEVEDTPVD